MTSALQLDLFGDVLGTEQRRRVEVLTCLRDEIPEALEVVLHLRYPDGRRDTRAPKKSDEWAYCVCKAGIRAESTDEWSRGARERGEVYGWDRTPAQLLGWEELAELVGDDPRRTEIAAWADSLTAPDRWRDLIRPHELWPCYWLPSYITGDHDRPGWTERRRAWQLVLDLLSDAIEAIR